MELPLRGVVVPMVTPMATPTELDTAGIDRLLEHLIAGGSSGIFALGTTGEAAALGSKLRKKALPHICKTVAGRVPVIAAVSDPSLFEAIDLARHAADAGADAVAVSAPYYIPVDQDELGDFYEAIARESPLPVFLYNIPQLTQTVIEPATVARLLSIDHIVGIKDSSGDIDYFEKVVAAAKPRENYTLMVGMEQNLVPAIRLGAHGCVGGGANVWPSNLVAIYHAAVAGEYDRAVEMSEQQARLLEICKFGTLFPGIVRGFKCALDVLGVASDVPVAPIRPCNQEQREFIAGRLTELGILKAP